MKQEDVKPLNVTIPGLGQVYLYFVDPWDEKEYFNNGQIAKEVDSFLTLSRIAHEFSLTEGPQSFLIEPFGSGISIILSSMIDTTKQIIADFRNEIGTGTDFRLKTPRVITD